MLVAILRQRDTGLGKSANLYYARWTASKTMSRLAEQRSSSRRLAAEETMSRIPRGDWTNTLREFSDRNARRRTVLEVDDSWRDPITDTGEYQLRGVTYDPRSDSIQIMLGQLEGARRALTHRVSFPTGVEILPREGDRGEALLIRGREENALIALI